MRISLLIILFLPLVCCLPTQAQSSAARSGESSWNVITKDGRQYLTDKDLQRFFGFQSYRKSGKQGIWSTGKFTMKASVGSKQLRIGDVLFNLANTVESQGNTLLISRLDFEKLLRPVLKPSQLGKRGKFTTVVIDAGHGGHDAGASQNGLREKTLALYLASRIGEHLNAMGYRVVYTRRGDQFLTLAQRVKIANNHPRAIFLSLHYNSAKNRQARGIETFALSPQGVAHYGRNVRSSDAQAAKGNARDAENITLATAVHGSLRRSTQAPDRGIRRARWTVLQGLSIPGILIEGGFLSNSADAQLLKNRTYLDKQALAIARGVSNYSKAISKD